MAKKDYDIFTPKTRAIVFGMQTNAVQRMMDFDYVAKRKKPSVACIVNPGRTTTHRAFWGDKEVMIPVWPDIATALANHKDVDVMVNFASMRSSYGTSKEALETDQIRTVIIIAEGVPEHRTRELVALAAKKNKVIIGPATVGGVAAGAFKIGNTGGTIDNIVECKLHRPGSVGFVSKSGGMSNEMFKMCALNTDGIYEGIAIGGDKFPGSTLLSHLIRYEANPKIKMLVCLGELGGDEEYKIRDAVKSGKIKKPLVMWVTGTCAKAFPSGVQFGHAGAKADAEAETADAKNKALKEAGIYVPKSYDDFGELIHDVYVEKVCKGKEPADKAEVVTKTPMDYKQAVKEGLVRKPTSFVTTIADDSGEELLYAGVPISEVIEGDYGLGGVISLLWFKKKLPKWATDFLELCIQITADHGPCVSGAHNAIVTARAGKDMISALVSGMLTIGPRFGGAVDGAARIFKWAVENDYEPNDFVKEMKSKNVNIQGIGHRIKSTTNPDKRVELLKDYAHANFPDTRLLDYALEVEKITTSKKNNLILNVDGTIGILFVDLMWTCGKFTPEEVDEIVEIGYLNGLFVLGRSIGMMGHYFDQRRLKSGLYRHPMDDVLYMLPDESEL